MQCRHNNILNGNSYKLKRATIKHPSLPQPLSSVPSPHSSSPLHLLEFDTQRPFAQEKLAQADDKQKDSLISTHGIRAEIIYRGIGNESRAPYIE